MSEYAKTWLNEWVTAKVVAAPYQQQKRQAVEVYVPACRADAMKVGITRRELEAAASGDLAVFFETAIEDRMDIEVHKNRPA